MFCLKGDPPRGALLQKAYYDDIQIPDLVAFRRAVQENGFALAATTISSISNGNDSPERFEVVIDGISLRAVVGYVHPLPFAHDYIGATVLIGVFHRRDYESKVSKLPEHLLPEEYDLDAPLSLVARITNDRVDDQYRGYF